MEKHYHLTDSEFEKQFENRTLDPALFTHEAHLRLAWIHINKYGSDKSCIMISNQIIKFATKHGDPDKFNKTVTIAAIKILDHFVLKSTSDNFKDFIEEFPRLKYNFKDLLDAHYSFDIFKSEKARIKYIAPDLLAF